MIFNSIEFLVFLPLVLLVYFTLNHKQQNFWLLAASYLFYGWWDPRFLFLISLSTTVDFFCGIMIYHKKIQKNEIFTGLAYLLGSCFLFLGLFSSAYSDSVAILSYGLIMVAIVGGAILLFHYFNNKKKINNERVFLVISIVSNLGLLAFFKYFNFFIDSAKAVFLNLGVSEVSVTHLNIILPVGISFYTFQTLSYTIDVYRKKLRPCRSFLDFALFVSYFPQLVAGPIERATNLLPRITKPRKVSQEQIYAGTSLIAYGLFKKVVIADGLAGPVASIYGSSVTGTWLDVVIATLFFTIQIYCDFSGYSDIARGVSKLLGIELMLNFRFPYFSRNPSEFWKRWHISLSSWLRDYLYISLGGNRVSTFKRYRNLMVTMILGGLWHGAAWNYVLWGIYQGSLLCTYLLFTPLIPQASHKVWRNLSSVLALFLFFLLTMYGWLLFRAESFEQIVSFSSTLIFDFGNTSMSITKPALPVIAGLPIFIILEFRGYILDKSNVVMSSLHSSNIFLLTIKSIMIATMFLIFIAALSTPPTEFIYFQF